MLVCFIYAAATFGSIVINYRQYRAGRLNRWQLALMVALSILLGGILISLIIPAEGR